MGFFSRMTGFGRFCVIALIFAAIGGVIYYTGFNKVAAEYMENITGGGSAPSSQNENTTQPAQTPATSNSKPQTTPKPVAKKIDAVIVAKAGFGNSPLLSGNAGFVSSDNSIVVNDLGLRLKMIVKNDDKSVCDALSSGEAQIAYCPSYLVGKANAKNVRVLMELNYNMDAQSTDCLIARADWFVKNKALASKIAKAFIGVRTGDVKAK
ncbi:MAG: hypothetical protein II623_05625 [Paludibacteraceae bacterium]|nr:hypothetical protein [Paludibacteraceae bacterium]